MRIIIKELSATGVNLGETILCDGTAKGLNLWVGPDGLSIDGQIDAQVQSFLRAESVKVWNRKNQRIAVSFRCRRDCGTVEAAEAFIIRFYSSCKRGTQLVMASGTTTQIKINNAAMPGIKLTHIGVLVLAEFNIVGGSIS
jgi:hypothetical protein